MYIYVHVCIRIHEGIDAYVGIKALHAVTLGTTLQVCPWRFSASMAMTFALSCPRSRVEI